MENQDQSQQPPVPQAPIGMQPALPDSNAALVLGIISIPTCICYGLPSLVCGIIAIVLGGKAVKVYKANPQLYSVGSYNNANAGKICGIVGVSLSVLFVVYVIVVVLFFGTIMTSIFSGMPWEPVN